MIIASNTYNYYYNDPMLDLAPTWPGVNPKRDPFIGGLARYDVTLDPEADIYSLDQVWVANIASAAVPVWSTSSKLIYTWTLEQTGINNTWNEQVDFVVLDIESGEVLLDTNAWVGPDETLDELEDLKGNAANTMQMVGVINGTDLYQGTLKGLFKVSLNDT